MSTTTKVATITVITPVTTIPESVATPVGRYLRLSLALNVVGVFVS